jgi:hypothetical protein
MKYILALSLALILAGCRDNPSDPVYNSVYFPLRSGNNWNYSGTGDMRIEIESLVVLRGVYYFRTVRTFSEASDTLFLRYRSNDQLMIYFEGDEYLYIDFSLPAGSTWDSYYFFYGQMRRRDLNTTVSAGIFSNVIEVLFENTRVSDVFEMNQYAPGVGMISSAGFRRYFELHSAFVNGVNFP